MFFDLEKAYDSTWKYGIMKDLQTINRITQFLKPGADCSLYVDDFQVCYISSNMSIIERQLQLCLNKLQQWTIDNGFQFSMTKTVYAYLPEKRSPFISKALFDKRPIPVLEKTKFMWVIFDRRLSFDILNILKRRA